MPIRIIRHEAVPDCGSFEARFDDGRDSVYFYWEDNPRRRLRPEQVDSRRVLQEAKTFAGRERDKIEGKGNSPKTAPTPTRKPPRACWLTSCADRSSRASCPTPTRV
jgi:hypothetical protein